MKKIFIPAAFAFCALINPAEAALVLTGDFVAGTTTPTLTFTEDIEFVMSGHSGAFAMTITGWGIARGGFESVSATSGSAVSADLNGAAVSIPLDVLYDDMGMTVDYSVGLLTFDEFTFAAGDVFRILAGSYTFESNSNFDPALIGTVFTGEVMLVSQSLEPISNAVLVPEPAVMLLGSLGMLGLLRRRR